MESGIELLAAEAAYAGRFRLAFALFAVTLELRLGGLVDPPRPRAPAARRSVRRDSSGAENGLPA